MPAEGTLTETGSDAGKTFGGADVGCADGTAVSTGDAGLAVAAAGIAEALVPQPVSNSKATAADTSWHLRRALVELVIRLVISDPAALCLNGRAAANDHRADDGGDDKAAKREEARAVVY